MLSLVVGSMVAETRMAEVSLQYREEIASNGTSGWWYILIPFAATGIAFLIRYVASRPPAIVNAPDGMLHELCKAHRINANGRMLLTMIAEEAGLEHPATLFTGTTEFDEAVGKATKQMKLDRRKDATLAMLRRRLFPA